MPKDLVEEEAIFLKEMKDDKIYEKYGKKYGEDLAKELLELWRESRLALDRKICLFEVLRMKYIRDGHKNRKDNILYKKPYLDRFFEKPLQSYSRNRSNSTSPKDLTDKEVRVLKYIKDEKIAEEYSEEYATMVFKTLTKKSRNVSSKGLDFDKVEKDIRQEQIDKDILPRPPKISQSELDKKIDRANLDMENDND